MIGNKLCGLFYVDNKIYAVCNVVTSSPLWPWRENMDAIAKVTTITFFDLEHIYLPYLMLI